MKAPLPKPSLRFRLLLQVFAMAAFFGTGCGMIQNRTASTSCSAGTAQINVYDGYLVRVCGCTQTGGVTFGPGQSLQCTVDAGTRVFFNFVSLQNQHTIAVTGVGNTATMQPKPNETQTGVIWLNNTGTFNFTDVGYGTGGTFIVN